MKENQKKAAFTLIELLIVVAIIGILAAIAVPNFMNARMRASVSRAQSDLRNLSVALESYRLDNNHYPPASLEGGTTRITVFQR
ncbi:MAG TPA: prepilin-type N-terminal cleavage/methylation domain-containing protein, partial [bacterium]|nr:prepilin-type N-terminal cleavage/methylation domain-containing protein [bacterium]